MIVTGASKGIGKGIARVFAAKGAKVLLAARDLAQAEAAAAEIRSAGGIASAVAADVSIPDDCARMAATGNRAPRRHRHRVLQRRRVSFRQTRRHDGRRLGSGSRHQSQGHVSHRERLPPRTQGARQGPHHRHFVHHRAHHRISRLEPLCGQQSRTTRFRSHRGHRTRAAPYHRERGAAGKHSDRGCGSARPGLHCAA